MSPLKSLLNFLNKSKIKYEVVEHKTVYTAMDKARTLHVEPKSVVKTAVVKLDPPARVALGQVGRGRDYAIALIPANKLLDKNKLKAVVNKYRKKTGQKAIKKVDFATEAWMKKNLSGQVGATPPFGLLWKISTFVDVSLLRQAKLFVNAGHYNFSLKMSRAGFEKAIGEVVKGSFSKSKK